MTDPYDSELARAAAVFQGGRGFCSVRLVYGVEHTPTGLSYGVYEPVVSYPSRHGPCTVPVAAHLPEPVDDFGGERG